MSLTCENYTEKSIVVRGDTKEYKEELKKLGGKYNANLKGGGGWIFSKKVEDKVFQFISSPKVEGTPVIQKEDKCNNPTKIIPLMSEIKKYIYTLSSEQKIEFINEVVCMCKPTVKIIVSSSTDDIEVIESDEEFITPKRLLNR
jgi:hypothetical protein